MDIILRIVFLIGILKTSIAQDHPQVCINDGCLIGINETSRLNRNYYSFLGIPYAKPPLGNLRFKPPEKPDSWGTLNATQDGTICPQSIFFRSPNGPVGDEDCLYLNVYTPQINSPTWSASVLLPVMVWLHPGGYMIWAGTRSYFGGSYFMDRDVVVVAPNYRLNVFGFLSTEDEECHGNWGLKDQSHALRWVKENIANFGGDPDRVTIFGQSAGGVSSHFHMLSPLSRGLFHNAIAQSGSALSVFSFICIPGEAENHALTLGRYLGCPTDNSSVLVACLRGKSTEELLDADTIFTTWDQVPSIPYKPVVESCHKGAFLTASPTDLIEEGQSVDVPLMTGVVVKEGTVLSARYVSNETLLEDMEANITKSFPAMLMYNGASCAQIPIITDKIKHFYFDDRNITTAEIAGITDMVSDHFFLYPFARTIELHKKHQKCPIYAYSFEYTSPITFANIMGYPSRDYNGTSHLDDLIYLFPTEKTFFLGYVHSPEEIAMTERMLDFWTNFAVHGNPTPNGYDFKWLPVSRPVEHLMIKGPNDLIMTKNFYSKRMAFWRRLDLENRVCHLHQRISTIFHHCGLHGQCDRERRHRCPKTRENGKQSHGPHVVCGKCI